MFAKPMKQNLRLLILIVAPLFLLNCNESGNEEPENIQAGLQVEPQDLLAAATAGEYSLNISSNTVWTITCDSKAWCRPNITQAKGNVVVKLKIDKNTTTSARTAKLSIVDTQKTLDPIVVSVTQEAGEESGGTERPDYIAADNSRMRNMTSLEIAPEMGQAWNLGNALESYPGGETSWGNPATTQVLIDSVKNAGFKTVRIPVAWSSKLESQAPEYKIPEAWLSRVKEVVDYVINSDMYAIINIHWDGGWADSLYYAKQNEIEAKQAALWKQIAKYFRDYDDFLLFAGGNEPHVDYEEPAQEYLDVANAMNQVFVNTVRATGGRNYYRHLISQGYNTNITHTVNGFVLPGDKDDVQNRQMVEIHFYDPYDFALDTESSITTWEADSWGKEDWVDEVFGKMKTRFIDQGIAVLMGEYGAIYRSHLTGTALTEHEISRNYYLRYVTKAALSNNIIPAYWDNGGRGEGGFALFDRNTGAIVNRPALNAIINFNKE